MAKYKYIGGGTGVPGLPHEIADEEADALGMKSILMEAVKNGSYSAINDQSSVTSDQLSVISDQKATGKKPKADKEQ